MILELTSLEASILTLSLLKCRKNVRNGFKRNYGKQEGKEKLSNYDQLSEIVKEVAAELSEIETEPIKKIQMYETEMNMLHSFLDWYIPEVKSTLKEAAKETGKDISEEDQNHLDSLLGIKKKADELKGLSYA